MPTARAYNVDSGLATGIAIGTGGTPGTEYVVMYGSTGAAADYNISAVRVGTYSASSASYPSNGTITWRLRRVSGTATGTLVGTATAGNVGGTAVAAQSTWMYATANGSGTASFATYSTVLWEQTIPATAGANWGEWFTPGFEINCPVNGTVALTYELGAAGHD